MSINISNILAQLNTKMTTDSSSTTTELLRRVKAYNDLNNAGRVFEYQSYGDLPTVDSSNIGQLAYVRSSLDDSFGTFFFSKALANDSGYLSAIDSTNSGWQKIVLNANDSDNFADIVAASGVSYTFQGSVSGYTSGGGTPSPYINNIEKFSFSVDGNATDVGDLLVETAHHAGQSSTNNGYSSGGNPSPLSGNTIVKFPFSTDANATDVGDLINAFRYVTGQSSANNGYTSGGYISGLQNVIQKFPFSSDGNATDVGDLTNARQALSGQSSSDNGYSAGGMPFTNVIDKFPFSTDANATDVGDLTNSPRYVTGQSSADNGYASGGNLPALSNVIQKWSFASDANATDVGDTTAARFASSGQSSTVSGYTSGGFSPSLPGPGTFNIIDKFPFTTDANATDVGDLVTASAYAAGHQV